MHAPRPTLAQALRSGELVAALPRLVAFAAKRLGAAGACAEGPSGDEAEDVVQEAVVRCLEGGRSWPEGVSLEQFLLGVVRSVASRWRRRAERRLVVWLEDQGEPRAPSSRRHEALAAGQLLAAVEDALDGDPELRVLLAVLAGGDTKPADVAAALGWTPERASVVRRRMQRRLAAAGLYNGDEDERNERQGPARDAPAPRRVSR